MWLGGSCKAELPQQVSSDAGLNTSCSLFADQFISYTSPEFEASSAEGIKALGAPDQMSVALGPNTVLTVGFLGLIGIKDEPGDDFLIHAVINPGSQVAAYVGFGENELEFSGWLTSDQNTVDLRIATTRSVSYLQLVGIMGTASIDAFEVLQGRCP